MSIPKEFHLTFAHQSASYDIRLVEGQEAKHKVYINDTLYALLGEEEKLEIAEKILRAANLHSISGLEDLKGRLSQPSDLPTLLPQKPGITSAQQPLQPTPSQNTVGSENVINGPVGAIMDKYLERMAETTGFSGSLLVERDGQLLLCAGYGQESGASKNSPITRFHIASLTKQFTAAAILQLHKRKQLDLHASINTYLSEECRCEKWREITPHQLLLHRSGICDYTERVDYWEICNTLTVTGVIEEAKAKDLRFSPDTDFYYSNTGYFLLGKIIENISGLTYGAYITREILTPAGMGDSGVHDSSYSPSPHTATGYRIDSSGKRVEETRDEFNVLYADGAIYSTARDMGKWSSILDGQSDLLSADSVDLMVKNGYGLHRQQILGRPCIHHTGTMAGFNAHFVKFPQDHVTVIALGNNLDFPADYLTGTLSQMLFTPNYEAPCPISSPVDFNYSPYLGTFHSKALKERGITFTFELCEGRLLLLGDGPKECFYLSNGRILNNGVEFELQPDGTLKAYDNTGVEMDLLTKVA